MKALKRASMNKFRWTAESIELLRAWTRAGKPKDSIAEELGCIPHTVRDKQVTLGLVKRIEKHPWSPEQDAALIRDYATISARDIANSLRHTISSIYNRAHKLGLEKDPQFAVNIAKAKLAPAGIATRFKKGQVPLNKGLRRPGWTRGRMAETQFKPGLRTGIAAKNWQPVGTIRPDSEGFLRIKVREGKKGEAYGFGNTKIWPLLNRHVWEQHHGPIPPAHIVAFKDGDRSNCDIANLELLSCADNMRRNIIHRLPTDLRDTIMLLGAVKRRLRERNAKEHDDGSAQPSV